MLKNEILKSLNKPSEKLWRYVKQADKQTDHIMRMACEFFRTAISSIPCFYLGKMDAEDFVKNHEDLAIFATERSDKEFVVKYQPIFDHLPYDEFCLCWYEHYKQIPGLPIQYLVRIRKYEPELVPKHCRKPNHFLPWMMDSGVFYIDYPAIHPEIPKYTHFYPCRVLVSHKYNEHLKNDSIKVEQLSPLRSWQIDTNLLPIENVCWEWLHGVITLIRLLNCKNIEVRDRTTNTRKNKRRPELDYKVLTIKTPGKGILYRGERIKEIQFDEREKFGMVGMKRGHFKTFGSDGRGLLFGKLAGTWWWSPIFNVHNRDYEVVQTKD